MSRVVLNDAMLHLSLRTYLGYPWDPTLACVESNFGPLERAVDVPVSQTAMVLVDVWHDHFIQSHLQRVDAIVRERIVPAIAAAREVGIPVVHCPSPRQAPRYPQHARYALPPREIAPTPPPAGVVWPPSAFRRREGPYAAFGQPMGPAMRAGNERANGYRIHPAVEPAAHDPVIGTGEELQHYLAEQRLLHLVYAGFAANACLPFRDYGVRAMKSRGYHCIVLRDCTTAIEGADTLPELRATFQSIRDLEMSGSALTTTSDQFIAACGLVAGESKIAVAAEPAVAGR